MYSITYGELSKNGFIPPIIYRKVKIQLTTEEKSKLSTKEGKNQAFRSKLCRNAKNKYQMIEKIIKAPFTGQILIFTSRISHAGKIHAYLESKKIKSTLLVGSEVNNAKEREEVLQKFRTKVINILILVKMLNEGFDAPADTVIIVSGSKNKRDNIQRCGRTTRLGHIAKIFELIVDKDDLDTEDIIAQERDISNIIQPWIQDKLVEKIDKNLLKEVDEIVGGGNYRTKSSTYEFEITSSDLL
jgi:superfamily II DNA or RNA helicase